jgi:potassium/hydrogen antiporter
MPDLSSNLTDIGAVSLFLLIIAAILLIGTLAEELFRRTNIPDVVWLIVVGVILGPLAGVSARVEVAAAIPFFAALALIVILTDGASRLRLSELTRSAPRATLLAILSFGFSVLVVAFAAGVAAWAGVLPDSWTVTHGILLGVIVGGPSSLVIMPAMAQASVRPAVANLLNLESTLTDVLCIVGASTVIEIILAGQFELSDPLVSVGRSIGLGIGLGLLFSLVFSPASAFIASDRRRYPVTLSAYLIAYVVIDQLGGSGAIGVFVFALFLAPLRAALIRRFSREEVDQPQSDGGFQSQVAFVVKSFFFTLIGFMLAPPWPLVFTGIAIGLVLLAARVPAVYLATLFSEIGRRHRLLVSVSLPRGMAAGALATLPLTAGVPDTEGLQAIVFACISTTVLLFAVGFPIARSRSTPLAVEPIPESTGDSIASDEPGAPATAGDAAPPVNGEPLEDGPAPSG